MQPGERINNLEHTQHELEGDRNATLLDYRNGNVCIRFAGVRSSQGRHELWSQAEWKSVLESQCGQ
jgi:hypothetical protein